MRIIFYTNGLEKITADTYGNTFSNYSKDDFEKFLQPLHARFRKNNINPPSVFRGMNCLDAGCGGGRGSIFMAANGARTITGIDFSEENIKTSDRFAKEYGFDYVCTFRQATLLDLPFEDGVFDIVFCNGVLMHTANPSKVLRELSRVLATNGGMWIYVYGSGGVYWYVTDWIRKYLNNHNISIKTCMDYLAALGEPTGTISEKMDDWYVGYRAMYTSKDFERSLASLGFDAHRCMRGMIYDTSERRIVHTPDMEKTLMGEGDLRYWCRKTRSGKMFPLLPAGGSMYQYPDTITQIDNILNDIEGILSNTSDEKRVVLAMKNIHEAVRNELYSTNPYDLQKVISKISLLIKG